MGQKDGPMMRPKQALSATLAALAALAVALLLTSTPYAAEPPVELKWDQLVPPAPPKPRKPVSFLPPGGAGDPAAQAGAPSVNAPPPSAPEGKWMSVPSKSDGPVPVVEAFNGKRVHIGGYVVPLDFTATTIKEFLLVPFVGACIHVPPPPANQIIYVKSEKGLEVQGSFDPVYVTGTMKVEPAFTGLAEAGYSIDADKIDRSAQ